MTSPSHLLTLLLDTLVATCRIEGTAVIETKHNPSLERAAQCLVGAKLLTYEGGDKYSEVQSEGSK